MGAQGGGGAGVPYIATLNIGRKMLIRAKIFREMGGYKLVAGLLSTTALRVRIQTSLTNTKRAIYKHTLARQKISQKES